MKYGETLRQRSIPEWSHYNIDYDYLKDLIKHHTAPGGGKALSIPGQGATTEKAFEDTFFKVLKAQHDRINLFIKSKSGEIERRLEYIGRQLAQIQSRRPATDVGSRLPAKSIEKYAKIDADVTKAGEEIRSLSRFRIAQRTGFYKILKKYKRWTKDRELEQQFKKEVIRDPDSYFQLDLGHLLDQYIDVLGAVRALLDNSGTSNPPLESNQRSSASRLGQVTAEGSGVDFDVALTSIPLGSQGSKAVYWIHPENIVEVEVLLLQHTRVYTSTESKSNSHRESPDATPLRRKSSATADKYFGNADDVGLIVLDHPELFAQRQNATTIDSSEEAAGTVPAKAAGNARWTSSGEAAVVVGLDSNQGADGNPVSIAKMKRKYLESFLDPNLHPQDSSTRTLSGTATRMEGSTKDSNAAVRNWLDDHNDVTAIAGVCSTRTRFVGLHNGLAGGVWATLDRDIFLKDSIHKTLSSNEWLSEARAASTAFPHALLEIRREGTQSAGLTHLLDRSYLVERVRGFSLETHAVWICCQPTTMSPPTWMPLLSQDIRKLPAPAGRLRRIAPSITDSSSHRSPPQTSTSTTSVASPHPSRNGETSATSVSDFIDPTPLRAFRKKPRKTYVEYSSLDDVEAARTQRYWNEYDNPESGDEGGYYIYVDPNVSVKMPGQELLEAWMRKTRKLLRLGKSADEQSSSLLSAAEDGSSDDDETVDDSLNGSTKNYGTISPHAADRPHEGYFSNLFRVLRDPYRDSQQSQRERHSLLTEIHVRQHEREMAKLHLYSSCLTAAAILTIILGILISTSRRKLRGEVDIAILLGVICNLLLLGVAVTSMKTRRERLGWFHQGFVYVVVLAMMAADVLLFRWALSL